jgi:hypothetical protein
MEHIGKKVFLAVAQQPFEHIGESGFVNNFATLVPLLTTDGEILDPYDFRHFGMVFWMVRQHALRFADPGRLLVGKLEHAVNPGRLEYQLTPDSADVVQPSDLIEVVPVEHPDVREPRDLVNIDSVLVLDHPPTSLVLARWGDDLYGPFRVESRSAQPGRAPWLVNLRTHRPDQTIYKIPSADLGAADKFGAHFRPDLTARITYESRYEYWDDTAGTPTHVCHYSLLLGAGFKKLPTMGYPLLSVETDRELLIRYSKRFLNRKDIQRLRELLPVVDPVLDPRGETATDAEKHVFEAVRRRAGQLEDELNALAKALVASGLIDDRIASAVSLKVQEHISQQAATLSADIAAKISAVRNELENLERRRDGLADEVESKRRQSEREVEQLREEFEKHKAAEEANIETARRDLDQQRATLSTHLESVIEKYQVARDDTINQFLLLAPLFQRAGLPAAANSVASEAGAQRSGTAEPVSFPAFVTGTVDEEPALSELDFFERFERHVKDCGYSYRRLDLASFHVSVKCCDITILGGISGTGKSTLPLLYAEALAGQSAPPPPGRYLHVGVSPAWLDMRDLLGHVNSLDRRFEPSESGLFRQLINAQQESLRKQQECGIYVVTLDEMNLSHVEHYFSGFLQALEHNREIRSFDAGSVNPDSTFAPFAKLTIPRSVRFVGTVNFDETTKQLSLRLLDRANLIRLRPMDQAAILPAVTDQRPAVAGASVRLHHLREWRRTTPLDRDIAALWDRIQTHLANLGTPITPRRRMAIQEFIASAPPEVLTPVQAFDLEIAQRLLTQVRGLYRPGAQDALDDLERALTQHSYGFPEAVAAIADLRQVEQVALPISEVPGF